MIPETTKIFVGKVLPQLDEKQRRIFLGALSEMLGRGSVKDLHELTQISQVTIIEGKKECENIEPNPTFKLTGKNRCSDGDRLRAEGGGRKSIRDKYPQVVDEINRLLETCTVGNPENPLCWTTKSLRNLEASLKGKGISVSYVTIGNILEEMGYSLQHNRKYTESGNAGPDRDAQFQYINDKAKEFMNDKNPVISVDARKKELIGNYKNQGKEYARKAIR